MISSETTESPAWDEALLRDPHGVVDKPSRVRRMFAAIAPSYDLNNRLHSMWMDQRWRRKAVEYAAPKSTDHVVDVACGTGDLTLAFYDALIWECSRKNRRLISPAMAQVIGVDFTFEMLPRARHKAANVWFH